MDQITVSLDEIYDLSLKALVGAGVSPANAAPVANSMREAEAEGVKAVGLAYLPYYLAHVKSGRVDGQATPKVTKTGASSFHVDACDGFAHVAFEAAEEDFYAAARETGMAGLSIGRSYISGVVGYFADRIAKAGLIGFASTNASRTVAPAGGNRPFFGTNPLAFGVPRKGHPPIVIDLSTSQTARINLTRAAQRGEKVPETWGFDAQGKPCSDPAEILANSLAPMAGYKGTGLGLMVEVLAAGLAGALWSNEVHDLGDQKGGPTRLGQFYMAINPERFAGSGFAGRIEELVTEFRQIEGAHLPGDSRHAARVRTAREGVVIDKALQQTLLDYANANS